MAVEWVALGGLAVAALGVVAPIFNSRVERRAAHLSWLRSERMAVYPSALDDIERILERHADQALHDPQTTITLRKVALLGGPDVQKALGQLVNAIGRDGEEEGPTPSSAQGELLKAMRAELRDGA